MDVTCSCGNSLESQLIQSSSIAFHLEQVQLRRQMAMAAMLLTWVITMCFLAGLFDDRLAARVALVWPPFTVLFPSLMAYVGWYARLGSEETKFMAGLDAAKRGAS